MMRLSFEATLRTEWTPVETRKPDELLCRAYEMLEMALHIFWTHSSQTKVGDLFRASRDVVQSRTKQLTFSSYTNTAPVVTWSKVPRVSRRQVIGINTLLVRFLLQSSHYGRLVKNKIFLSETL